ncbi:hypothetical protein B7P43_G02680 [Cryptotermes secundus]|uniref:Uncharacterized protein n=1 Tax=Cryptotermes secundus TaxID=105785 RepID=A0A2J7QCK3_9NEOP|nr:hypothetical protein B7P43_G02680 [Cryptotermes secundus]
MACDQVIISLWNASGCSLFILVHSPDWFSSVLLYRIIHQVSGLNVNVSGMSLLYQAVHIAQRFIQYSGTGEFYVVAYFKFMFRQH